MGVDIFLVTSDNQPVQYNGETYEPLAIGRTSIQQDKEINRANITLTIPRTHPVALAHLNSPPDVPTTVTIFRHESRDGESPNPITLVYWKGRVAGAKAADSEVSLSVESVFTSLRRYGLKARYQRGCRHALYGRGCWLAKEDFAVSITIDSMTTLQVFSSQAAAYADEWFIGGMIEFDGVFRHIIGHAGNMLTLDRRFAKLETGFSESGYGLNYGNYYGGVDVKIYPGCKHDREDCNTKFNNLPNYGGYDHIPNKAPFGGGSIA